jgi:hypothetical protein
VNLLAIWLQALKVGWFKAGYWFMAIEFRKQRRNFGGYSLLRLALSMLCMLVATVVGSSAHASIVCPEPASVSLEDLLSAADAKSASSCASHSAPVEQSSQNEYERELARLLSLSPSAIPSGGSTSGTSASGSGAGASGVSALSFATAIVLCDADVVRWVAGDQRLALPMPPGNDLLRPPQSI